MASRHAVLVFVVCCIATGAFAALQLPSLAAAELERKGKFTPEAQAEAFRALARNLAARVSVETFAAR